MRFSLLGALASLFGLGLGLGVVAIGCEPAIDSYGPASECSNDGGHCSAGSAGGIVGDGGTGGTTTGTGTVVLGELKGDVQRFADSTFATTTGTAVTGALGITFRPASGPQIVAPYGGSTGTTFDVMNVPSGAAWVYVQDESNGAAGIWPTVTAVSVPQLGAFTVPVVDQGTFMNLASNLPSVQNAGVSTQAAQIVLLLQYQGQPFSGVNVTGGASGAIVVYDTGPGVYSDSALTTGSGGTIILFNAGGSGMAMISVTSMLLTKSYTLPVNTVAGAVTVVGFDLQ